MPNFVFHKAEPDENFPLYRAVSEDGSYEVGLTPMLFGVRVRAGRVGAMSADIDYCAGADIGFQFQLLTTIIAILETIPVGTSSGDICRLMPRYEKRPINLDPCWPALQALLAERAGFDLPDSLKPVLEEWAAKQP